MLVLKEDDSLDEAFTGDQGFFANAGLHADDGGGRRLKAAVAEAAEMTAGLDNKINNLQANMMLIQRLYLTEASRCELISYIICR